MPVTDAFARMKPRTVLAGGWALFMVYAFPGFMTWDAMTQLAQARRGSYTDDHPPLLAIVWRFLEHFVRGPLPMLVVWSLIFLFATYKLFGTVLSERRAAWCAALVLLFPPIGTVIALVLKDTLMVGSLVAAVALFVRPGKWPPWLGLALIFAGTQFRYNAIAATLPLVILLFRFGSTVGWRRYAIAALAWFCVTLASFAASKALADEETHYWHWSQAIMDISDTLVFSRDYSDAEVEQLLAGMPIHAHDHIQQRLRELWSPVDFRHLTTGERRVFDKPNMAEQRAAIEAAWSRVVFGNFTAYLEYRWETFSALMRFDHAVWVNAYTRFTMPNHDDLEFLGHGAQMSKLQEPITDAIKELSRTGLFDPGPYLIIAILLLPLCLRERLAGALLLSGVGYQLAYFLIAPTADYRYSQYMVTTTVLGTMLLFIARYRRTVDH